MAHVRQQIRERVGGTTVSGLSTTGTKVYQSRVYDLNSTNLPCLLVYTQSEESEPDIMGTTRHINRILTLNIEAVVKAVSNFDDTLDTICSEVEVAMGNDNTINNLAKSSFLSSTEIEFNGEGDQPVATATLSYSIQYITAENAPDTAL